MAQSRGSAPDNPDPTIPQVARMHVWQFQAVRDIIFFAAIIGLVWAGYAMRAVTVPLLVALLLAYLFEPLVTKLTRNPRTSRPMVVGGLVAIVGLMLVLLLILTIPPVITQSKKLIDDVQGGRFRTTILRAREYVPENYQNTYEQAVRWLLPDMNGVGEPGPSSTIPADGLDDIAATQPEAPDIVVAPLRVEEDRIRQIVQEELLARHDEAPSVSGTPGSLLEMLRGGTRAALRFVGTIVQLGLLAFLIPFYFFFFSVSYPAVVRFGRNLIPEANRARAMDLIGKMDRAVAGFVRGRIVICLICGTLLALLWWIVGVPYAIVLGLVTGIFFIVPFLSGIGIPLAVILLALDQISTPAEVRMAWWWIILGPTLMYLIVNAVETYVLTPLIAGKATNLDPVTILVAVLAGGSVGGVYGMILAIPLAACAKILLTDVLLPRIKQWVRGEAEDPLPISRT